MRLKPPYLYNE